MEYFGLAYGATTIASTILAFTPYAIADGVMALVDVATWAFAYGRTDLYFIETCYINTRMTKQYKEQQYYEDDSYSKRRGDH